MFGGEVALQRSAMNCSRSTVQQHVAVGEGEVKLEDVTVKLEPLECAVCAGAATGAALDAPAAVTPASRTPLRAFLCRFTAREPPRDAPRHLCAACLELVHALDRAEVAYLRLKDSFEALLDKSPLLARAPVAPLADVKCERARDRDSEDEPLADTKRRAGKGVKKKKKASSAGKKRKTSSTGKYSWECDECGVGGEAGGPIALAAHKITEHSLHEEIDIKTEDNHIDDGSNGMDNDIEVAFGDFDDDDADSTFNPDEFHEEPRKKVKARAGFKQPKVWHPCDLCNARYSSLVRLEQHKLKHDGSKPPYICEVCGAHYKHKRACDIHIALHKGISDWKCEECNKLFPSKNALQRHNNIHTGKLNYQCDLCGKSFIHTSSFKMHKLSHSGVKPHACDVCGLALMTRSHLKRHKRIHSGEKRHECTLCGKRFSERYNLAAHAKSHEAPPAAEPAPRRRLFRCHFCTERFERRYMLERHMSALHGRTLERPPPTPRNTMSKLLKAQAQARTRPDPRDEAEAEAKAGRAAGSPVPPSKLLAHLTSQSPSLIAGSWGAPYAELAYSQP